MKSEKKVSIVLPVYNGEKRVAKAIKSILNQTYKNFELILVNDCSTDKTGEVLENFEKTDSRIKVIHNEVNKRLPMTLNVGFSYASGDYLTWTSDDNTYKSDAIMTMVNYLDINDGVDMVYCDFDIVDLNGNYISTTKALEPDKMKFENAVGACFLYRRELADKIGEYDAELFLAEDYEYWIKAYLNGTLHHIPEVHYYYGWHDGSLTVMKQKQVYHKTYEAKNKHFDELLLKCVNQDEKNQFYWRMLRLLLDNNEREKVKRMYYKQDKAFEKADKQLVHNEHFHKSFCGKVLCRLRKMRCFSN